jgi:starch synthase (maltosyl-transferring)
MSRNEPFENVPTANDHPDQAISLSQALLAPRIVIEDTQPVLEAGTFAAKAISGQPVVVGSKVYCDGHDRLAVMLNWRQANSRRWHCVPMHSPGNDLWLAEFTPTELARTCSVSRPGSTRLPPIATTWRKNTTPASR